MYKCNFCKRESNSKSGNSYHEKRCKMNPNRKPGYCWNKGISTPSNASYKREIEPISVLDMSKRTTMKILRRMKLPCSQPKCGWYVEGIVGDLHHIISRKEGGSNENDNLTYICPNCHRLAGNGLIK